MNRKTRERGYMPQLDALRFFAVMGVLFVHTWPGSADVVVVGLADWGELGVRLFFVLSGFLITGILLGGREAISAEPARRWHVARQFYVRRFLRIFPIYYLVIAVLFVAGTGPVREMWPWLVTYTTNIQIWHSLSFPYAVAHFWSLAVEEQFYLVWPWLILFLPRKWLLPVLLALCLMGPSWRLFASFRYSTAHGPAFTLTVGVVDFLAIGALLAVVWHDKARRENVQRLLTRYVLPLGLTLYVVMECLSRWGDQHAPAALKETGAALVFCWLVASASRGFKGVGGWLLEVRPVVYLGKISYGIYIYHYLVPVALVSVAEHAGMNYTNDGFLNFIGVSLLTFGIAALSWRLFESPINGLKRRFAYETQPSPAQQSAIVPVS